MPTSVLSNTGDTARSSSARRFAARTRRRRGSISRLVHDDKSLLLVWCRNGLGASSCQLQQIAKAAESDECCIPTVSRRESQRAAKADTCLSKKEDTRLRSHALQRREQTPQTWRVCGNRPIFTQPVQTPGETPIPRRRCRAYLASDAGNSVSVLSPTQGHRKGSHAAGPCVRGEFTHLRNGHRNNCVWRAAYA